MEFKNRMYQLYELRDELKKALDNVNLVESQEKLLVGLITGSKHAEVFKDFVNGTKSNWEEYKNQRANLNTRLKYVNELITMHENKVINVDKVVSYLLEAIGATRPEKKKLDA